MLARVFAVCAYLIGIAGAGFFFIYVIGMGTGHWPRPEESNLSGDWGHNLLLLLLFAFQHSGMARRRFKQRLGVLARSFYVAASGIVLTALVLFWQPLPGEPLWQGPTWIVGISLIAAALTGCCVWRFDHASFLGLTQVWTGRAEIPTPLCIDGPYRYVRHPLMLGFLIAIWTQPIMWPELAMMNAGMTIYVLIAIELEERDLVEEFGEAYGTYRRRVPMLIPWKWW
ncbi:MAG: isoprenylcysteine carboxylmethyltransferase family protein [Planctomycetes bacterium]|nr:isoprenylcysteine carboxylmethyltransferase family protein [Planctomycetota bacterium]